MSAVLSAQYGGMTEQECNRLRQYIVANVIGDNPPPLTVEAQDLIRAMLGSDHAGESVTA